VGWRRDCLNPENGIIWRIGIFALPSAVIKSTFFLILCSLCVSWGAETSEGLILESQQVESIEERRAEAMGKQLDQFVTMAGRVYRDVKITKISDGGISFSHADGAARLMFGDLGPEQRRYFGINGEDASAVYAREMRARAAYEKEVEKREKARRELAAKEAADRAEAQRLATEKAEKARAIAAASQPEETIPLYPTIKRVDSGLRRSSRYSSGFGYGYPVRYSYSPSFRYRGSSCRPFFGGGIHIRVR
jgi:hypothetical protein